jgi:protein-disulfide isomerase
MSLQIPVNENDHSQGPEDAPVTLIEYGDYQCPYCGKAHPIVKRLQEALQDDLRFVFRNFPLTQVHPMAMPAAQAAEAATFQDKFWEMHDYIFEHQSELSPEGLLQFAIDLQMDPEQLAADMERPEVKQKIERDFKYGVRSGVNGTPTFFINGVRYDGPISYEFLLQALTALSR